MATHESSRHPFQQIFRSRFTVAPKLIIYDNACKLHQYCLNREPCFFDHTQFAVDRFHWHGHIGYLAIYSLDKYSSSAEMRVINSQVNEQANAWLQHIKRNMSADNFSSVTFFGSEKHRCILYVYVWVQISLLSKSLYQNCCYVNDHDCGCPNLGKPGPILKPARIGICVSA